MLIEIKQKDMPCPLKRTHTLSNGQQKEYHYSSIGGKPIKQYRKDQYQPHKKTPKYETLPQAMKDEILRLRKLSLGYNLIWRIVNNDPRFEKTPIGHTSIRKFLNNKAIIK